MTHTIHKLKFSIRLACLAAGALVSALSAQTPAWFPLEVGNTWLYRVVPGSNRAINLEPRTISVHGKVTISGREYFDVNYMGRELLLRAEPSNGSVILYDRTSNSEQTWAALGAPVGTTFPTAINPCPTTGVIAARDVSVTVPAGSFSNAVEVKFQGNCVDVGATDQFYAPYVGLVSDEETTIFGPVKMELIYYRTGSSTASAPELSFTVALDASRYEAGGTLQARLTLRNTTADTIPLHFASGQSYDLKILTEKGDVVGIWSKGRAFTMIVRDETLATGERTYGLTMPLADLPPGHYLAQAYLTTNPLMYLGEVSFQIGPKQGAEGLSLPRPGGMRGH